MRKYLAQVDALQLPAAIYLHIPFCKTKCSYCSFNSQAGKDDIIPAYLRALHSQIHFMAAHPWSRGRTFSSLFIGGGTPTICDSRDLAGLIATTLTHFHFTKDAEITVETNPNTVSEEKIVALLKAGFNRLSIGVQSFAEKHLRSLGRSHSADDVKRAVVLSQKEGLTNINLDLIFGLPGQKVTEWHQSLETAMELEPSHLALYELMVEDDTPLACSLAAGKCHFPDGDEVAGMEGIPATLCKDCGIERYEISNFAKPGFQCRHNNNDWKKLSWLRMGAGAVASLSGTKISHVADPATYTKLIENKKEPIGEIECLSRQALFRETVIMGLRLLKGVSISELKKRFALTPQEYYGEELNRLISQGLLTLSGDMMHLTPTALPVANQVLSRLV